MANCPGDGETGVSLTPGETGAALTGAALTGAAANGSAGVCSHGDGGTGCSKVDGISGDGSVYVGTAALADTRAAGIDTAGEL